MNAPRTDARPHPFEPTYDEMVALKRLEMGQEINVTQAVHQHLPGRLEEGGYIVKTAQGLYALTDAGRQLIRRAN